VTGAPSGYRYTRPSTIAEAVGALASTDGPVHLLAGGTALGLLQRQGLIGPGLIVDLAGVPGLDRLELGDSEIGGINVDRAALRIGAMVTLRRVETDPLIRQHHPLLASALRHVATVGGNLAHADPAQDPPPALLALDAGVVVAGPAGSRTIPLAVFFRDVFETALDPGEVVTRIDVPLGPPGRRAAYRKFLPRTVDDYATVSVAARLDFGSDSRIGEARIALGSVAPVPLRVPAAEALLRDRRAEDVDLDAVADAVIAAVDPVDDVRGSAAYKRAMAGVWSWRVVAGLLDREDAARPLPAEGRG
jgi:carbon-monoxide dehydrogenase medium subunit